MNKNNETINTFIELQNYWHNKTTKEASTPQLLQEKLIICIKSIVQLYKKGKIENIEGMPSTETVRNQDAYDLFKTAIYIDQYIPFKKN